MDADLRNVTDAVQVDPADFDVDNYVFGGKVAESIGASLSGSRDEQGVDVIRKKDDERRKKAAYANDWFTELEPLSFEERVDKTIECLGRRQSFMNTLRGLLSFCDTERTYEEIDEYVRGYAEFEANKTSSHRYVFFLRRTGALEELEINEQGEIITDEMRAEAREAGLSEEEVEDMAVEWHVITTDVGREALKRTDPSLRLADLLSVKPSRVPTYRRVLEFCSEKPRSLDEISRLLENDPGLEINEATGAAGMQPSAYISKLDQAGVLVWNGAWATTEEGVRAIREFSSQPVG